MKNVIIAMLIASGAASATNFKVSGQGKCSKMGPYQVSIDVNETAHLAGDKEAYVVKETYLPTSGQAVSFTHTFRTKQDGSLEVENADGSPAGRGYCTELGEQKRWCTYHVKTTLPDGTQAYVIASKYVDLKAGTGVRQGYVIDLQGNRISNWSDSLTIQKN